MIPVPCRISSHCEVKLRRMIRMGEEGGSGGAGKGGPS
jgi:hypothetical protein